MHSTSIKHDRERSERVQNFTVGSNRIITVRAGLTCEVIGLKGIGLYFT